jgi:hypothetical protein
MTAHERALEAIAKRKDIKREGRLRRRALRRKREATDAKRHKAIKAPQGDG